MTTTHYDQREDAFLAQRISQAVAPSIANTSGIDPLDLRVLVHPDPVEERSKGGIILAQSVVEANKHATVKATLVALGTNAFSEAMQHPDFERPKPGARIMIAKYGGVQIKGADGEEYRIMNDADIVALLKED